MTTIDLSTVWTDAWTDALREQMASTQVPVDQWRKAGRPTRDKPNAEDLQWWYETGLSQLEAYAEWLDKTGWTPVVIDGVPAIELELVAEFGGVQVKGYLDCAYDMGTGEILLVDYKTGSRTPATFMQLGLYASMLEIRTGVRPQLGAYYMTRKGQLSPTESLDRYSIEWLNRIMPRLARGIEYGIFVPNLGDYCGRCDVQQYCYAAGGDLAQHFDPDHPQYTERNAT